MADEVENPFSQFIVMAAFLHEVYKSFVDAGFQEYQAIQLTVTLLGTLGKGIVSNDD